MMRSLVVILLGFLTSEGSMVCAQDPIMDQLEKAKAAHEAASEQARVNFLAKIDATVGDVGNSGDLDGVKALRAAKATFQATGELPSNPLLRTASQKFQNELRKINGELDRAYQAAVKEYTKKLDLDKAELMQAERHAFQETLSKGDSTQSGNREDNRRCWAYSGGSGGYYFKAMGTDWLEKIGTSGSGVFAETARTKDYVEMRSMTSGDLVRMYDTKMLQKTLADPEFKYSRDGKWVPVPK